jgi:hypothetical protein
MLQSQKTRKNVHNNHNMDRRLSRVSSPLSPQRQHHPPSRRIRRTKKLAWVFLYALACIVSVAWRQAVAATAATGGGPKDSSPPPIKEKNGGKDSSSSLLLLTTADGHLYVLNAWTGEFQTSCKSGAPLVTRSVAATPPPASSSQHGEDQNNEQNDSSSSSMIVIPGLDGKLYWQYPPGSTFKDEDDDDDDDGYEGAGGLLDTDLSIPHLLEHPVRSCNSDGTNCGILSAVAHTTLFGIDTETGSLVWSSSGDNAASSGSDGSSSTDSSSGSSSGSSSRSSSSTTVVLQRKDYWIRHISTATGRQLWNVTLGTYQALDFDSTEDDDDDFEYDNFYDNGGKDDSNKDDDDPWLSLPSAHRVQDKRETLAYVGQATAGPRRRLRKPALPALFFSQGGRQLAAVEPLSSPSFPGKPQQKLNDEELDDDDLHAQERQYRKVLWRIEAPHIVTSVFGIHQGRWKALTVLDEADVFPTVSSGDTIASTNTPITLQLPSEPYNKEVRDDEYRIYHGQHGGRRQDFASAWMRQEQAQWTQMVYNKQQNERYQQQRQHQRLMPSSSGALTSYSGKHHHHDARSSYCVATTDANGEYSFQCPVTSDDGHWQQKPLLLLPGGSPAPPRSTMIYAEGLLLSWTMVGIFFVGLLGLAVAARIWYKRRKHSWLVKAAQVGIDLDSHHQHHSTAARSNSVRWHRHQPPAGQLLQRSSSESDTYLLGGGDSSIQSMPLLRPQGSDGSAAHALAKRLHAMGRHNNNGKDDDDDGHDNAVTAHSITTKTTGTTPPLVATNASSEEGVAVTASAAAAVATSTALVVFPTNRTPPLLPVVQHAGGIPLVRYSRYASEFVELKALGKGGFGSVFSCKNNLDGRDYAIVSAKRVV